MASPAQEVPVEHHDILIIGAGLTGINAAHRLREQLPHRTFTIVEARPVLGGTWTFWRYPGIRSDASLRCFALAWHPWKHAHKIASAREIAEYLEDAARQDGTLDKVRVRHRVLGCDWSSEAQKWRLQVDADGVPKMYEANFVLNCMGYYAYDRALKSPIPGLDNFAGDVVHPQWWPEDVDYSDKRVVIIGSGATAVTMLPAMAEAAKSVTMLQRSPSYVASIPRFSALEDFLRLLLPLVWVHWVARWIDVTHEVMISEFMMRCPRLARSLLTSDMRRELPKHVDVAVHFNPSYEPFQQRLCLTPDGEFFQALHRDNCEVVTGVIETVTQDGILLKSGRELPADMIITATGLHVQLLGGLVPRVDGKPVDMGQQYLWRGCLVEGLPNLATIIGYVTTSWTPGIDTIVQLVVRVMKQMEAEGATSVVPVIERKEGMPKRPAVTVTSNYILKGADRMPKVTGKTPFYGRVSLMVDTWALWFGSVKEGLLYQGSKDSKKTK